MRLLIKTLFKLIKEMFRCRSNHHHESDHNYGKAQYGTQGVKKHNLKNFVGITISGL